jgi:hypothetical protein
MTIVGEEEKVFLSSTDKELEVTTVPTLTLNSGWRYDDVEY